MGSPKIEATSLCGGSFSSCLRALCLIFKDLFERWCFAAQVVAMFYAWCGFLPSENTQCWRNKDISFGVCCSIWHFNLLKPSIEDFFLTVILVIISYLFKIRRENTSTDKKNCLKYGGVRNMKVWIMESHLQVLVRECSPCQGNSLNKRDVRIMESQIKGGPLYCNSSKNLEYLLELHIRPYGDVLITPAGTRDVILPQRTRDVILPSG